MRSFLMDLRHSARMLVKHPMLTVICVVTISLGIGLTTTMFSVINGSIWEQLPYDDADRLMIIARTNLTQSQSRMGVSIHDFEDWRSRQTTFEDITAWYGGTINFNNEGETPIRYQGAFIVPSAFDLIGVPPLMGRVFTDEERLPEAASVIVLSYRVWQARFGGDPEILGSTVRVNGLPTTVIGVMPEGYAFPNQEDVWVPQKQDPSQIERNGGVLLQVVGKLKEGVSQAQAQAEFSVIAAALAEEYPETNEDIGARVMGYDEAIMDTEDRTILYLMLAGMFAVLLIACFNVANLLLSRAVIRSKEMAVRSSLGATRRALVGQMLLEALAFAVVGGAVGLLLGHIGIGIFDRAAASTEPPWWFDFSIDGRVVLFVLFLVALSAIVSGILPALQSSSTGVTEILKGESRGSSSFRMGRFSKALVVAEVAFSCGLLVIAGLMTKSMLQVGRFDFGIESENVFTARLGLFVDDYPSVETRIAFWAELNERVKALPEVASAGLADFLPLSGAGGTSFVIEGEEYPEDAEYPTTQLKSVSPGYFEAFGLDLLRGRGIEASDAAGNMQVAVVNQSFVDEHFPGEDPIGRRAGPDTSGEGPWYTIIGIVEDEWTSTENDNPAIAYASLYQNDARFLSLAARTRGEPMEITQAVRSLVMDIDPNMPIYWVFSMTEVIQNRTWFYTIFGGLMVTAGVLALFMAAVGLYGVMAFSVSRRTRELGVRMALGAQPGRLRSMILRQGAWQLGLGLAIGLGLAVLASSAMQLLLFGVQPSDPVVYALIITVLVATGFVACLVPARRATRVDPVSVLNTE